jgi:hypothetical protein
MNDQVFPYDVFLSHSSKDKAVVRTLAERLRQDGLNVWFDVRALKPGDSILAKIEEGLEWFRFTFQPSALSFSAFLYMAHFRERLKSLADLSRRIPEETRLLARPLLCGPRQHRERNRLKLLPHFLSDLLSDNSLGGEE